MPFFTRSKPSVISSPLPPQPAKVIPAALPTIFDERYNLISLSEASQRPEIVYRTMGNAESFVIVESDEGYYASDAIDGLAEYTGRPKLISLQAAASCKAIKYRREGFEMDEARAHIMAMRAE